jgi:hypothetical protein
MDWAVQTVIDLKDQVKFKVLLSSRTPAPSGRSYRSTKKRGERIDEG